MLGAIVDAACVDNVRRLSRADPKTGDPPTLRAAAHAWCALDLDGVQRPARMPAADLSACAAEAVRHLPPEFRGARCVVQATSSHGIKPGSYLRLWFWLDRLVTLEKLTVWLKRCPVVDRSLFQPAKVITTATPIFERARDHLPTRIAERPGAPCVVVPPIRIPKRRPIVAPAPGSTTPVNGNAVVAAVLARLAAVPEGEKHDRLLRTALLLGGVQHELGFADDDAVRWLVDALPRTVDDWEKAEKTARDGLAAGAARPIAAAEVLARVEPWDQRHRETARQAGRMLRARVPDRQIVDDLDTHNAARAAPLSREAMQRVVLWATAKQIEEKR